MEADFTPEAASQAKVSTPPAASSFLVAAVVAARPSGSVCFFFFEVPLTDDPQRSDTTPQRHQRKPGRKRLVFHTLQFQCL